MSELIGRTAAELADLLAANETSSVEVAQAMLDRIDQTDDVINAFLHVDADGAMSAAREADERRAAGETRGPLDGIPVAVKDLFAQAGVVTTAGSKILQGWVPPYDATVIRRLREAGLVILGKTNLDEFAMGSSSENSAYGPTRNPWDIERIPGGSGGGSAAALAAYQAPLALGTDTGGSIRQPGAMTGTVGIKPTYGGTSRYGVIAMASSLDTPGPCARKVLDAALLHAAIGGHDPRDATSIDAPVPDVVAAARSGDIGAMRVGVIRELSGEGYAPGVEAKFGETVALLEQLGAEIVEVSCPHIGYALAAYYLIMPAEVSSNLARYDAMRYGLRAGDDGSASAEQVMATTRESGFGEEVKRRVILGTYALSAGYYDAYYGTAQKVRTLIKKDFAAAFGQADVLLSPTAPTTAFRLGERVSDPLAMYLNDVCSIPANLAGIPAASFPVGVSVDDGLPVGLQVMAPTLADDRMYRVGAALEAALPGEWGLARIATGSLGAGTGSVGEEAQR